jgi:hypothetical protein
VATVFNLIAASDEYTLVTADVDVIGAVLGAVLWAFIARSCENLQKVTFD